ncbi:MAG: DUF2202 domain-containing protein [Propionibacteriaceae bacterium]|nr:DUF2202 domain-containing protein [Propionibacteriaceae bacterium]
MTTRKSVRLAAAAVAALTALAVVPAFAGTPTDRPAPNCTGPCATAGPQATAPLSDAEKADILFMREEERLAKELYEALGDKWGVAQFDRIAASEQRHFDAMGRAVARYQLEDPSKGAKVGVYADPKLQELWDDWHGRGMESKEAAFAVGVELEKADIADLKKAIDTSDNADLDRVYGNLLRGSENHLRAFEALVRGETMGMGQGRGQGGQGQHRGWNYQGQRGQGQGQNDQGQRRQGWQRGQDQGQQGQGWQRGQGRGWQDCPNR